MSELAQRYEWPQMEPDLNLIEWDEPHVDKVYGWRLALAYLGAVAFCIGFWSMVIWAI